MLSSVAEFVVDALGELMSAVSFSAVVILLIGVGLGFFIGRQDALSQVQACQKTSTSCGVYIEKSALGDWLAVPVSKKQMASAAE